MLEKVIREGSEMRFRLQDSGEMILVRHRKSWSMQCEVELTLRIQSAESKIRDTDMRRNSYLYQKSDIGKCWTKFTGSV